LLVGYFASIPKELGEAALVDGAGHLQMLVRIFLPVTVPGLIAATIFAFTVLWSGFLYPLGFYHWGGLMAGALLACLPPVLLYVFLMDYYISGSSRAAPRADHRPPLGGTRGVRWLPRTGAAPPASPSGKEEGRSAGFT
jgi:multiple sugar transport system permease protein